MGRCVECLDGKYSGSGGDVTCYHKGNGLRDMPMWFELCGSFRPKGRQASDDVLENIANVAQSALANLSVIYDGSNVQYPIRDAMRCLERICTLVVGERARIAK